MSTLIKLCGMTCAEDVRLAGDLGADFFGVVVEVGWSKRSCSIEHTASIFEDAALRGFRGAALFCDHDSDFVLRASSRINPHAIQLQGTETPEFLSGIKGKTNCEVWKAVHLMPKGEPRVDLDSVLRRCVEFREAGADLIILDTLVKSAGETKFGGTGQVGDWETASEIVSRLGGPIFLAGGIEPENVHEAILQVKPSGVDLASGVETSPGIKDKGKMERLVREARRS